MDIANGRVSHAHETVTSFAQETSLPIQSAPCSVATVTIDEHMLNTAEVSEVNVQHDVQVEVGDSNEVNSEVVHQLIVDEHPITLEDTASFLKVCDPIGVVVYAPPHSGKSTYLNSEAPFFVDSDALLDWNSYLQSNVMTNIPYLITCAKFSYAIVPSRTLFNERCRLRGLEPLDCWYDDVLHYAKRASVSIYTDEYVGQVFHRLRELRPPDPGPGI